MSSSRAFRNFSKHMSNSGRALHRGPVVLSIPCSCPSLGGSQRGQNKSLWNHDNRCDMVVLSCEEKRTTSPAAVCSDAPHFSNVTLNSNPNCCSSVLLSFGEKCVNSTEVWFLQLSEEWFHIHCGESNVLRECSQEKGSERGGAGEGKTVQHGHSLGRDKLGPDPMGSSAARIAPRADPLLRPGVCFFKPLCQSVIVPCLL